MNKPKTNVGAYKDTGTVYIQHIFSDGRVAEVEYSIPCSARVIRLLIKAHFLAIRYSIKKWFKN